MRKLNNAVQFLYFLVLESEIQKGQVTFKVWWVAELGLNRDALNACGTLGKLAVEPLWTSTFSPEISAM